MDTNPLAGDPDQGLIALVLPVIPCFAGLLASPHNCQCLHTQIWGCLSHSSSSPSPSPVLRVCVCVCVCVCVFGCAIWLVGSKFPDQGSNPGPRHWKHRVLTTGPPGNSRHLLFFPAPSPVLSTWGSWTSTFTMILFFCIPVVLVI